MVYNLICHVAFINTSEILNFEGKEGFCARSWHPLFYAIIFMFSSIWKTIRINYNKIS